MSSVALDMQHVYTGSCWPVTNSSSPCADSYVGLETFDDRAGRWAFLTHADGRIRFGLIIDTGAESGVVGSAWCERYTEEVLKPRGLHDQILFKDTQASFVGIGAGAQNADTAVMLPCAVDGMSSMYTATVLDGEESQFVPALLGLNKLRERRTDIMLSDPKDPHMIVDSDDGSRRVKIPLIFFSGHLIMPIDAFCEESNARHGCPLPPCEVFCKDPLGIRTWVAESHEPESPAIAPPVVRSAAPQPIVQDAEPQLVLPAVVPRPAPPVVPRPAAPPVVQNQPQRVLAVRQPLTDTVTRAELSRILAAMRTASRLHELSRRAQVKYQGLPANAPVPEVDLSGPNWDVWEWWAGEGGVSKACAKQPIAPGGRFMRTGPPITLSTGWDIRLTTHQTALRKILLQKHVLVVVFEPTCGPWSSSNTTMPKHELDIVREHELHALNFMVEIAGLQVALGHYFVKEQPRASERLRLDIGLKMLKLAGRGDQVCDMCRHGLKDPVNNMPNKKPTAWRGNFELRRVALRCQGNHTHQHLQGRLPGGKCRTEVAQTYTAVLCKRLARDIADVVFLHSHYRNSPLPAKVNMTKNTLEHEYVEAFPAKKPAAEPAEDSDGMDELLEQLRLDVEEDDRRNPSAPSGRAPVTPDPGARAPVTPLPDRSSPSTPSGLHPRFEDPSDWIGGDVPEELRAPDRAGPLPEPVPAAAPAAAPADAPAEQAVVPAEPASRQRPSAVQHEDSEILDVLCKRSAPRMGDGGAVTIQAGDKLRQLQTLVGDPHGYKILMAFLCRRPSGMPNPEPIMSREHIQVMLCLIKQGEVQKTWHSTGWTEVNYKIKFKKKPAWFIVVFGRPRDGRDDDAIVPAPNESSAEQRAAIRDQPDLPGILQCLADGTTDEKIKMILQLHKRFYHKSASQLRALLQKAGVPLRALALVETACDLCTICKAWARRGTIPSVKARLSGSFNELVYGDLVFFESQVYLFLVDDCIRWVIIEAIEYKDFISLEQAFRRAWVAHYGPPKRFRCDREGGLSNDAFGTYLEKLGCQRELVTADFDHTKLSPLDRRVGIFREMAPRLADDLSKDIVSIEREDIAAECQYALNSQLVSEKCSPYFGAFRMSSNRYAPC